MSSRRSYKGTERPRQNSQQWFDSVPGPIRVDIDIDIIDIVTDGVVAFAYCVNRVGEAEGDEANEVRARMCHRRVDGEWLAVHANQA
jgi:ketosteroid isomerase-like protein